MNLILELDKYRTYVQHIAKIADTCKKRERGIYSELKFPTFKHNTLYTESAVFHQWFYRIASS